MNNARSLHRSTLLNNGKVLVTGGYITGDIYVQSAELYDPTSEYWTLMGNMNSARYSHTASLLSNDKVLVTVEFLILNI